MSRKTSRCWTRSMHGQEHDASSKEGGEALREEEQLLDEEQMLGHRRSRSIERSKVLRQEQML
jgi:hypothetical protein